MTKLRSFTLAAPVALSLAALTLAACSSSSSGPYRMQNGRYLQPAPAPQYQGGERFIFTRGLVKKIERQANGMVQWQSSSDGQAQQSVNYWRPPSEWHGSKIRSRNYLVSGSANLWPLQVGKEAVFSLLYRLRDQKSGKIEEAREDWECAVTDTEMVSVPAGVFDTYVVQCLVERDRGRSEVRTYYHAPALQHFVQYTWQSGRAMRTVKLTHARLLDPSENPQMQKDLSKLQTGERSRWQDRDGKRWTMAVLRSYQNWGGDYCREVELSHNDESHPIAVPDLVCRDQSGLWRTLNQPYITQPVILPSS